MCDRIVGKGLMQIGEKGRRSYEAVYRRLLNRSNSWPANALAATAATAFACCSIQFVSKLILFLFPFSFRFSATAIFPKRLLRSMTKYANCWYFASERYTKKKKGDAYMRSLCR